MGADSAAGFDTYHKSAEDEPLASSLQRGFSLARPQLIICGDSKNIQWFTLRYCLSPLKGALSIQLSGGIMRLGAAILVALFLLAPTHSWSQNTPCSGSKGGIDHCQGDTFICNDGSVSASKRSCLAYTGRLSGGAAGLMDSNAVEMAPAQSGECSCRSGKYCVGPRGGHFCITDSGKKSYLRRE
ncbi:MAG: hypothetical protein QM636_11955 [Rhizobium sp.]